MRVVVDTNIFVSAALKADSAPRHAFRWIESHARVLKSVSTEEELSRTLAKPKLAGLLLAGEFLDRLTQMVRTAELVPIIERIQACRDPNDDKFLELAVNGHADLIVSGDRDLLVLDPFHGIPIIAPTVFIQGNAL